MKTRIATLLSLLVLMSSTCPRRLPGPDVKVYVSKPEMYGLYRKQSGELIHYEETENYRAMSKEDFDALLNWCLSPSEKIKSKRKRENLIHNLNLGI